MCSGTRLLSEWRDNVNQQGLPADVSARTVTKKTDVISVLMVTMETTAVNYMVYGHGYAGVKYNPRACSPNKKVCIVVSSVTFYSAS